MSTGRRPHLDSVEKAVALIGVFITHNDPVAARATLDDFAAVFNVDFGPGDIGALAGIAASIAIDLARLVEEEPQQLWSKYAAELIRLAEARSS